LIYFVHGNETSYLPPIAGTTSGAGNVGFNQNATLPFEPGKRYRLRVVNTSTFSMFYFWIDGHDMEIIEVDGVSTSFLAPQYGTNAPTKIDTNPMPVDLLAVTVAQRYSILVKARNDTSANYAIHANMDTDMFDTVPEALNPNITSSITYSSSAPLTSSPFIDEYTDVNDTALVPLDVIAQFVPAQKTIELEVWTDGLVNANAQ
jgi:iron transport multicopper oxidase